MPYTQAQLNNVSERCMDLVRAIATRGMIANGSEARQSAFAIGVMAGMTICNGSEEELAEMRLALGDLMDMVEPE